MTFRNSMTDSINELTSKYDTLNFKGGPGGYVRLTAYSSHYLSRTSDCGIYQNKSGFCQVMIPKVNLSCSYYRAKIESEISNIKSEAVAFET